MAVKSKKKKKSQTNNNQKNTKSKPCNSVTLGQLIVRRETLCFSTDVKPVPCTWKNKKDILYWQYLGRIRVVLGALVKGPLVMVS